MLRSLKAIEKYLISARDGDIGRVADFLLDDEHWTVRYLVAETGGLLGRRRVLISPVFFRKANWGTQRFHLDLTKDKIENSPSVELDKPVSRQHERDYSKYHGYPHYWGYSGVWGMGGHPGLLTSTTQSAPSPLEVEARDDMHLRSVNELRGYHIQGKDAAVGHVVDFIVDDESWQVRYLVVDTSHWWFGRKVLIAPHWTSRVDWSEKKIDVDLTRDQIKDSPEWNAEAPVDREYEERLYDYYGRAIYWEGGATPVAKPVRQPPEQQPSDATHGAHHVQR